MAITVVALDDHHLIRQGIRSLLEEDSDVVLVAEGSVGNQLYPLVQQHRPDIVLLDLSMPERESIPARPPSPPFRAFPAIARLRHDYPSTRVIVVSQHVSEILVEGALEAGVRGYLLKDDALTRNLADAIRLVHQGGVYFSDEIGECLGHNVGRPHPILSERQAEVLRAIASNPDRSQAEHARQLEISENTLKQHLRQIYRTLNVGNLTAAVLKAIQLGIVPYSVLDPVLCNGKDPPRSSPDLDSCKK